MSSPGVEISILINYVHYYLRFVFIEIKGGDYRLVVIHNDRVLTDKKYKTLGAAKAAFARMYNHKAWQKDVKPNWSHVYPPSKVWLEEKYKIMNRD